MTSVLYGASLNYQNGNPIRFEINKLTNSIGDLRKVVDLQNTEILALKGKVTSLEKGVPHVAVSTGGPTPAPGWQ